MRKLIELTRALARDVDALRFGPPVAYVYNPLLYARAPHEEYVRRFAHEGIEALWLGMNPGPFGMAQTGVPFGEIAAVKGWMSIDGAVGKPDREHPKRPIEGFACRRSEVSGARIWGLARDRFGAPEKFFERFFVWNYCPLVFMEEGGANVTPVQLRGESRSKLEAMCDATLRRVVAELRPRWVIGIGGFAQKRAELALEGTDVRIGTILHPSPASPAANRGWAEAAVGQLREMGIEW